jgi:hypothetical protein
MDNIFQKAIKRQIKLRLALLGPAGSGKTYSALEIAKHLGGKTALMDSEHASARKYADKFDFDVVEPTSFSPDKYIEIIQMAEQAGYDNLIIDSLSHAWAGKDGILEFVDEEKRKSRSGNAFTEGWGKATPKHNALIEAMLSCKMHLIVTMRTKMEYVIEEDPNTHKKTPRKIGLQPIQRDGLEYEFDVVGDLNQDNDFHITKTRCDQLNGKVITKPGKQLAEILKAWLADGVTPPPTPAPMAAPAPAEQPGNGNGNGKAAKAGAANSEKLLDDIGQQLWPGVWTEKKEALLKSKTVGGDIQKAIDYCLSRQKNLVVDGQLYKHVQASWPGYEALLAKLPAGGDAIKIIRGVASAAAKNAAADNGLNDAQMLGLIEAELTIPEGF